MHGGVSVADHLGGQFNPCKHRHTHRESDHPIWKSRLETTSGCGSSVPSPGQKSVGRGRPGQRAAFTRTLLDGPAVRPVSSPLCRRLGDRRRCSLGSNKKHGTAQKNDTHQLIRPHIILKFAHEIKQACLYHAYSRT